MEAHNWNETGPEGKRFYRATHHAGRWQLYTMLKGEEDWQKCEFTLELWLQVRDLLWRKYQRKRGSWKIIEKIDKHLADTYDYKIQP